MSKQVCCRKYVVPTTHWKLASLSSWRSKRYCTDVNAQQALRMDNGEVKFKTKLEAVIDAKGVFTSIENEDTKVPAEPSVFFAEFRASSP